MVAGIVVPGNGHITMIYLGECNGIDCYLHSIACVRLLASIGLFCLFVCFVVISAGGVEVLASSPSGGYFVLLGASFDGVYLEVGGWLAKCGGGCFARGTLLGIWARVLNLGGDLV